jgi:hypothetical protein
LDASCAQTPIDCNRTGNEKSPAEAGLFVSERLSGVAPRDQ